MCEYRITGGRPLAGQLTVQGAKNSVLPILAATLLNGGRNVLHNCPDLRDVSSAIQILEHLGCKGSREGDTVTVFAVNRSFETSAECSFCLPESAKLARHVTLSGYAPETVNTAQNAPVQPREVPVAENVTLPAGSWNMLVFAL